MRNLSYCPILGQLVMQCLDRTVSKMPMVGQLSDNVLSNCLIIAQCCVQQLDSVVSNSQMVGL